MALQRERAEQIAEKAKLRRATAKADRRKAQEQARGKPFAKRVGGQGEWWMFVMLKAGSRKLTPTIVTELSLLYKRRIAEERACLQETSELYRASRRVRNSVPQRPSTKRQRLAIHCREHDQPHDVAPVNTGHCRI